MIDRRSLLKDLKNLLKRIEKDLRKRAEPEGDAPRIHKMLQEEYGYARHCERTAATFEEWRAERITQKAAAWVLSCVFARFLEDNGLVHPPKIAGPGPRQQLAWDEHELYFREHPTETDREYLLNVFDDLAKLPGGEEVFGKHNAIRVYPGWIGGDAAGELLSFFQRIDAESGKLVHDFTDENWDTRFLGDLYQDLSEAARKKYALLQTPDFVEEFILDRTLEPALDEFGLNAPPVKNSKGEQIAPEGFRMIDPACGSGHFLLGAFDRIFERWLKKEPGESSRELARRTFESVYGVDINPFAVAIARFRLVLKAMKSCGVGRLENCPDFKLNLACGDSLLHGDGFMAQMELPFKAYDHCYKTENAAGLKRILKTGIYHSVVANPPYIQPKDKNQNLKIRERYVTCYRAYSLSVPFIERIFQLAVDGRTNLTGGYTGQITANSFMKREFGIKIIEKFFPSYDLTHVVDMGGAYLPGHGTPTVILFSRNRPPTTKKIRAVLGVCGEPTIPNDPAKGEVWISIKSLIDFPGKENKFVSVTDIAIEEFSRHPWTLSGGGGKHLFKTIKMSSSKKLKDIISDIGAVALTRCDDVFVIGKRASSRLGIEKNKICRYATGEDIRNWKIEMNNDAIWPYNSISLNAEYDGSVIRILWPYRTLLSIRKAFGKTQAEHGLEWFEYSMFFTYRFRLDNFLVYTHVSTHNHFVKGIADILYNRHALTIAFKKEIGPFIRNNVLCLLNSSLACFWLKQVSHNKGSTVDKRGARQRTMPFEDFWEFDSTKLKEFPLPRKSYECPYELVEYEVNKLNNYLPNDQSIFFYIKGNEPENFSEKWESSINVIVSLQEEIDWQIYGTFDLLKEDLSYKGPIIGIKLGQRAFEILMARKMMAGELKTTWFQRHGSKPIPEIPNHWPEDYKKIVEQRIKAIEENPRTIGLIEKPEYKRRWNLEPWDSQLEKALRNWLLDRLESYFDIDGRMNGEGKPTAKVEVGLISTARLADIAKADESFMKAAELYRKRPDFDPAALVSELMESESVPLLPSCRYKPTGMDKRAAWERTWRLQRLEDEIDELFDLRRLSEIEEDDLPAVFSDGIASLIEKTGVREVRALRVEKGRMETRDSEEWLIDRLKYLRSSVEKKKEDGKDGENPRLKIGTTNPVYTVKEHFAGDIAVPPKYNSQDFQSTVFWRHRGKLDVPKERWTSFPHCESEDRSLLVAWAGYDHLQVARAVIDRYTDIQEKTGGGEDPRLEILLACLCEIMPWLKQWHNEIDPEFEVRMGDYYEDFVADEANRMGKTVREIGKWSPPGKMNAKNGKNGKRG